MIKKIDELITSISPHTRFFFRRFVIFIAVAGPGLITAVADNDAGGIATYTVAAATFGIASQLLIIPTTLLLAQTQDIGSRLAIVTGKGLGDLIRERHGVRVATLVFVLYFIVNQGVVLQNISGLKASYQLFHFPWQIMLVLTCLFLTFVVVQFNYQKIQKIFLFMIMFYFSYVAVAILAKPNWYELAHEMLLPTKIKLGMNYWFSLVAVLGTTITAWGQFFVSSYVNDKKLTLDHLKYERAEIYIGAIITNFFSFMIAVAVAQTLFLSKIPVTTAEGAALTLQPLAGQLTFILFAAGLFGASILGLTIVPLATAYVFSEFFGYEGSLDTNFSRARLFYSFFIVQIIIGLLITLLPQVSLFKLTLYVDYLNGAMLPIIFYFLLRFAEDEEIMGTYVLKGFSRWFLRCSAIIVTVAVAITFIGKLLNIS